MPRPPEVAKPEWSFVRFFYPSIVLVGSILLLGAEPASKPSGDEMIDWLAQQATTAPAATQPATEPASPLMQSQNSPDARTGTITLSSGEKISGEISTTAEKPLRFWDEEAKEYHDIPLAKIKSMAAEVVWERDEEEWHFKESGSDVKEFTGKTYPARETRYAIKTVDGRDFVGGVVAPLYVLVNGESKMFVLHKRDKGEPGQKLAQLVYVTSVEMKSE